MYSHILRDTCEERLILNHKSCSQVTSFSSRSLQQNKKDLLIISLNFDPDPSKVTLQSGNNPPHRLKRLEGIPSGEHLPMALLVTPGTCWAQSLFIYIYMYLNLLMFIYIGIEMLWTRDIWMPKCVFIYYWQVLRVTVAIFAKHGWCWRPCLHVRAIC